MGEASNTRRRRDDGGFSDGGGSANASLAGQLKGLSATVDTIAQQQLELSREQSRTHSEIFAKLEQLSQAIMDVQQQQQQQQGRRLEP